MLLSTLLCIYFTAREHRFQFSEKKSHSYNNPNNENNEFFFRFLSLMDHHPLQLKVFLIKIQPPSNIFVQSCSEVKYFLRNEIEDLIIVFNFFLYCLVTHSSYLFSLRYYHVQNDYSLKGLCNM